MKIKLPNGCSCSKLAVNPTNWQTKNPKISKDWFISYRFYPPNDGKPKQVIIKGMNDFKTIEERQNETRRILETELVKLKEGYNPNNKQAAISNNKGLSLYIGDTVKLKFIDALNYGLQKAAVAGITTKDIAFSISQIKKQSDLLGFSELNINQITKRHLKHLIEQASCSNDRFNKHRSYLMILYSILSEEEIVDSNLLKEIKKKKVVKKIRKTLSEQERVVVSDHLKTNHPEFFRFLNIFFHSGARISEMMRLNEKDVEIEKQRFKLTILKGKQYKEVWKTIKDIALPFWIDLMKECDHSDYLFSKGLKPGKLMIKSYQIDKRWYRLVKKKLGIEADFYSLKHLHTTEVVDLINADAAAKHNSHTSTGMVNQVYDVKNVERKDLSVKNLNNPF